MFKIEVSTKKLGNLVIKMTPAMKMATINALDHSSRKFLKVLAAERLSAQTWFRSEPRQGIVKSPRGFFKSFRRLLNFSSYQPDSMTVATTSKLARMLETGYTPKTGTEGVPVPLSFEGRVLNAIGRPKRIQTANYLRKLKSVVRMVFKGQVYLTRVFKNSRQVLPLFVFKKDVKVQPHFQFYETFERHRSELYQIIAKDIMKGLKEAWQNG